MITEQQKRIDKAIKKKEARFTKQQLSINICWAVNNANNFLPEKLKGTPEGFTKIKNWIPKFMDLYQELFLAKMPIENVLDKVPKRAAKSQIEQEQTEGFKDPGINFEAFRKEPF